MNPTISLHCFNPHFDVDFVVGGTNQQGIGEASTAKIQFNINTDSSGPQVVFVNAHNNGICTAKISSGFRFLDGSAAGTWSIDGVDIFTTWLDEHAHQGQVAPIAALKDNVSIVWEKNAVDTGTFAVSPKNQTYKGTINVRLTVKYEKIT